MRVNPFQTLLIALALTVIGFALVPELTLKYLPTEKKPALTVQAYWRSASPEAVEREITSPLEAALSLVGGIDKIRSVSREGLCTIYLDLEQSGDLDLLRFEVATRVRQVAAGLPSGVTYPTLALSTGDDDDEEQPVLVYSLSGNLPPSELYTYARDEILPQLALTPELQRIDLAGGNAREWVLTTRPELLRTYALTDQDLAQTIDRMSSQEELGFAVYNNRPYPIRLYAPDTLTPDHLLALPLTTPAGQVIHLSDVAQLQVSEQIPQSYYRINGQNSLRLLCYPTVTANTITLAHLIKDQVGRIESTLPAGFHFYLDQDASEHLEAELNKIGWRSLLSLGILILFTLIAYRGWSYLVVLLSSLVVNLGLASMAYYYFGIELNLYALAGITVTFGMIMDNTIVMMHHLLKQGNRQVFPALIASTLTTISALIVVFFLPDVWKARLAEFAKVIMINLSISLLVSWWLVPAMLVKLGVRDKRDGKAMASRTSWRLASKRLYMRLLSSLIRWRGIAMVAAILAFGLPVFLLPNQIKGWDWYNGTLGNDWYVEHAKPVVNRVLGGTLRLFVWYVYEGSGYRTEGETMLHANARMPEGATVEQMNAAIQQIEQYLAQFPVEIRQFVSQVSSGQSGRITIRFYPEHQYSFPYLLKGRLTAYCTNLGGMDWSIYGVGQGFSTGSGGQPPRFRVVMKGYNQDELARWAQVFADSLLVHPRIQEVNTEGNIDWWARDRYEYFMQLDRRKLALAGIEPLQLRQLFSTYNRFRQPALYLPGNIPLRMEEEGLASHDLWQMEHTSFPIDSHRIQLGLMATLDKRKAAQAIHKEDQQYIRQVEWEYTGSAHFGSRYLDDRMAMMRQKLPLGYTMERETYDFWRKDEQKKTWLLLLVMGLIFFITTIHFESFRQAFSLLILIPLSFIGIFLTFYWFDFSFDQGGYTSFILLSGLVVNSLILIISDYQRFCKRFPGRSKLECYVRAFQHKITPILLTILSTALGLIPFLLAGDKEVFWFALAVGTIGGLIFSLVVIFCFIPVFVVGKQGV